MKKLMFGIVAFATCMMLASCGTKKAAVAQQPPYPNYAGQYPPQYQQYPPQQTVQEQPKKTIDDIMREREEEEMMKLNVCEYKSMHWEDNDIRAYGVGSGFDKEAARENAIINAEGELAAIMDRWISDVIDRTNTGTQLNGVNRQERVTQQDQVRMSELALRGRRQLCITYENIKGGGVECHVCYGIDVDAATNAILSQKEAAQLIENAERFREQANNIREEIRFQRTGENNATKKAEYENKMRQENLDKQHQRNMEQTALAKNNTPANTNMYSLSIGGQTYGPYNYAQLLQMVPTQQITPETYVWRIGLADWVQIKNLPELSGLFGIPGIPTTPPAPKF